MLVALESVIFFVSLLLLFFYGCFVFKKEISTWVFRLYRFIYLFFYLFRKWEYGEETGGQNLNKSQNTNKFNIPKNTALNLAIFFRLYQI